MSDLKREYSYLKGFVDGLKFNPETKEAEIIVKILSFLETTADHVDRLNKELSQSKKTMDAIHKNLTLFTQPAREENLVEISCPNCGQKTTLQSDEIKDRDELRCSLCENMILLRP